MGFWSIIQIGDWSPSKSSWWPTTLRNRNIQSIVRACEAENWDPQRTRPIQSRGKIEGLEQSRTVEGRSILERDAFNYLPCTVAPLYQEKWGPFNATINSRFCNKTVIRSGAWDWECTAWINIWGFF